MDNLKKKMSMKKFLLILVPLMVLLLGVIISVTAVMNAYSTVMNNLLGRPPVYVTPTEENKDWDADYYDKADGSKEEADAAAEKLAVQAMEEGAVLLKNNDNALPLKPGADGMTVNAFGWSFYYPVNGGAGAGAIGSDNLVSPEEALAAVGVNINQNLKTQYTDWTAANCKTWGAQTPARPTVSLGAALAHWDVPELDDPASVYDASGAAANDTSIVWLGRSGGEGADAPRQMDKAHGAVSFDQNPDKHYLELTNNEEKLIETVGAKSDKVIVILNSPSAMEIGELEDNENVDAVLWIGAPGKKGYNGFANVMTGTSPSGRLPDTFAADFLDNPTILNFSDPNIYASNKTEDILARYDEVLKYTKNGETMDRNVYYVGYEEGIYNGYRWYETAAAEGFFDDKTAPDGTTDKYYNRYYNRVSGVVYPFGAGLSYTTFSQKITSKTYEDGVFEFTVEVENTGDVAGKDVVQLYVEAPYTDGGIEKSKVTLAAFGKTKELAAGAKDTVTLSVKAEDIASYDDTTEKAYVLDAGTYTFYLSVANEVNYGSHGWAYATDDSKAVFDNAITEKIVYSEDKDGKRDSDAVAATNRFDENMKYNNLKVSDGSKTMSRKNFAATYPTAPTEADRQMSDELKAAVEYNSSFDTKENVQKHNDSDDTKPLINQDYGIKLIDLRGKDYDDPAWQSFVEQFTLDELKILANRSGWQTAEVTRLGKPMTAENDGPQCLKTASLGTDLGAQYLVAFPCEVVLAATWNQDLLYEIGRAIGEEGLQYGVNGWYAPATNTHRTPFSGRNFEYFSEDPVLAGKLCAREISGAASKGLYAFVKHFAVNDQESYARNLNAGASLEFSISGDSYTLKGNDCILLTWASEQTLREIYLRSFEIVFKEAKADVRYLDDQGNVQVIKDFKAGMATMTSFNCIGDTWAGGNRALITDVLRGEWGFEGFVLTDSVRTDFMYADQMLRAGGDACLMSTEIPIYDLDSATALNCLQSSVKNICYTVAHSNAMNGVAPGSTISYGLAPWAIGLLIGNIVIYGLIIGGIVWIILRARDAKKNPDKYKH